MEIPEYFVYFKFSELKSWDKRSGQIAKGEFLEVPRKKTLKENLSLSEAPESRRSVWAGAEGWDDLVPESALWKNFQ